MPLGKSEISHLADLARLQLDNRQITKMSTHLESVVIWFRQLDGVKLDPESIKSTVREHDSNLRLDMPQPSLSRLEALANAPDHDGTMFRVPGVMKR